MICRAVAARCHCCTRTGNMPAVHTVCMTGFLTIFLILTVTNALEPGIRRRAAIPGSCLSQ